MDPIMTAFAEHSQDAIPVHPLSPATWDDWIAAAAPVTRATLAALAYAPKPGKTAILHDAEGRIARVVTGIGATPDRWDFAGLPAALPPGLYRFEGLALDRATDAALAFALGHYRFSRYKKGEPSEARLVWPEGADRAYVEAAAEAVALVRDLVNTPANDMGPAELAEAARALAERCGAAFSVIEGEDLKAANYPMIHAVGIGSPRAPRLIDFSWGDPSHPKVTLVGKGVCFDTGGLDIKPADGMLTMKKDMGGAAHALGLASMIMRLGCKLRLRVLIPAVENSISGRAMRPLDVFATRAGLNVEIGNTDAEGRLVLADALAEASSETPAAIIDFATLTGAARVALGVDLPALFCNDEAMAAGLLAASAGTRDPFWRMPLWQPYAADLDGKTADLNNVSPGGFAGAITAALFMEKFVANQTPWAHFDVYAWNAKPRPGRPEGGEAFGLHACFSYLKSLEGHRVELPQRSARPRRS